MQVKRAYKYRFYPTEEQREHLSRTFGSSRFVYNRMLKMRTDVWKTEKKHIGYHETSAALTELKKNPEFPWLKEVSSVPLQQSLRHLQCAFTNFFAKRAGYPKFRTSHGEQSASYMLSSFTWDGRNKITLAKIKEPLNIRWSRTIPRAARVTSLTITRDTAGRYFVSILCEDEVSSLPTASGSIGVDLGLSHFLITSEGEKIGAPNIFRKHERKLARLQRSASRKLEAAKVRAGIPKDKPIPKGTVIPRSKNFRKDKLKIARLHAKIRDTRRDFLHKLSTRLIRENQTISTEALAVKHMVKNRKLSKSISDAGWAEFTRMLKYKAEWYGRTLVKVDKWFPSSKKCSTCGFVIPELSLSTRDWTCPICTIRHDRDINAAINIRAEGLSVLALGETVRPVSACA